MELKRKIKDSNEVRRIIKECRSKNTPWKKITKEIGVTEQRLRQIINEPKYQFCEKHTRRYLNMCSICESEKNFKRILKTIEDNGINSQIERLKTRIRTKEIVIQRSLLIKKLRDNLKLTFPKIANLLNRDPSSIMNLYYKKL